MRLEKTGYKLLFNKIRERANVPKYSNQKYCMVFVAMFFFQFQRSCALLIAARLWAKQARQVCDMHGCSEWLINFISGFKRRKTLGVYECISRCTESSLQA